MKQIVRKFLAMVLALTFIVGATVSITQTAQAANRGPSIIHCSKTVSCWGSATLKITNTSTTDNLQIKCEGGYCLQDGQTITIKPGKTATVRYTVLACKGATFTVYVLNDGTKHYSATFNNCKSV